MRWTEQQLADLLERRGVAGAPNRADTSAPPFALPADIVLDLPYPPSVNRLWRQGASDKRRVYLAPSYRKWKDAAERELMVAPGWSNRRITGAFSIALNLCPPTKHPRGDLDNRIKAVLDLLQSSGVVKNDRDCEELTARWVKMEGAPLGCRVTLRACV